MVQPYTGAGSEQPSDERHMLMATCARKLTVLHGKGDIGEEEGQGMIEAAGETPCGWFTQDNIVHIDTVLQAMLYFALYRSWHNRG